MHLNGLRHVDPMARLEEEGFSVLVLQIGCRRSLDLVVCDLGLAAQVADAGDLFGYAESYRGAPACTARGL